MARRVLPLKDTQIKAAKHKAKDYKLFDGGGLFLLVTKGGGKLWYLKYRFNAKEKKIALGAYPAISLSDARSKREALKKLIAQGKDPAEERKQRKAQLQQDEIKKENTFYLVSGKWWESYRSQVSENYHTRLGRALENYVYPHIKETPIDEVTRLEIIAILEALKAKGLDETAKRTAMLLNKVYKYAVTHEYTPHNIIADIDLPIVLGKREKKHYPTMTKDKEIKGLLLAIDDYSGDYFTKMALKILSFVFVRSYNIRHMEWVEIDFNAKSWIIPPEKMKTKEEFTIPLPHQVITLLEEIRKNSTGSRYVFPSFRSDGKPLSDNTLISALRRMGYSKEQLVPHSFRSIFSTIAYEWANKENGHGYTGEVIEACLAHKEANKIKGAYNRSEYKDAMRGLIQWYADYLEGVKRNG